MWIADLRRFSPDRGKERPVFLPDGSLFHPAGQQIDLAATETRRAGPGRRHAPAVIRCDSSYDFALDCIARHDAKTAAEIGCGARFDIKAQLALPIPLVRAVTCVTTVREDGPDIPVEFDRFGTRRRLR
jgi:hypothetical protein